MPAPAAAATIPEVGELLLAQTTHALNHYKRRFVFSAFGAGAGAGAGGGGGDDGKGKGKDYRKITTHTHTNLAQGVLSGWRWFLAPIRA